MKYLSGMHVVCLLALTCLGYSQVPTPVVTNPPSSTVSIALIDPSRPETIPSGLSQHTNKLPAGSFLLHNHTTTPITAVVVQWKITSRAGAIQTQKLQCTGYKISPRQVMVRANDFALITPRSCAKSELFSQLGNIAAGSPFKAPTSDRLVDTPDEAESIEITVDSVIFEDGGIWGPDRQKYYERLWQDQLALQSVLKDCSEAATRGEDVGTHAKKIKDDLQSKSDRDSDLRKHYASLLSHSPNPQKTFAQLQSREALPEFHHIEEGKQ